MTTLSVVVPFYNVAPYFSALLESLSAQHLKDVEFILVDDGSSDSSSQTASYWVRKDKRFRLIVQDNLGLSVARNVGVSHGVGEYLAFADADDIVPADAYSSLVKSLESTKSDFACGNVLRLTSEGNAPHRGYRDAFSHSRQRTHITRDHSLITDRMVWNKVFSRSFWDRHGFKFSLPRYEDAPVMIHAHIAAETVDVLDQVVYYWRRREAGEPSITQRIYEPDNLADLMHAVRVTGDIIRVHAPELIDVYERNVCLGDLRIAVAALLKNTAEELDTALEIGWNLLVQMNREVIEGLPEPYRTQTELFLQRDFDELREARRALESLPSSR
ncbi:glycosyltransferase family 2 protein [Streptomyces viridochromogenes]|uniref:glycosyltransferase family 2 protein n=1 Tax=Streptomyces viridochromogenes TaxID=1938 RepID=UPI00099C85C4|nr:glycosyltransferase [Streptomyces viridochromogenes]